MVKLKWYGKIKSFFVSKKHKETSNPTLDDSDKSSLDDVSSNKSINNRMSTPHSDASESDELYEDSFNSKYLAWNNVTPYYKDASLNYLSEALSENVSNMVTYEKGKKYHQKIIFNSVADDLHNCTGVVYLQETNLVLVHYITLYKIKMDLLNEPTFKHWCHIIGHTETSRMYKRFVTVYDGMKTNFFRESSVINKIVAKKNVQLRITDRFGDDNMKFRALIITGKRNLTVQNIIDSYCFSVKSKVPVIIRNKKELSKFSNPISHQFTQIEPNDWDVPPNFTSASVSRIPNYLGRNRNKDISEVSEPDFHSVRQSSIKRYDSVVNDPFARPITRLSSNSTKCIQIERPRFCYKNKRYKILNVISDDEFSYILCDGIDNGCDYINAKLARKINTNNQSNELNNESHVIYDMIKKDIVKAITPDFHIGVDIKNFPCGRLYKIEFNTKTSYENVEYDLKEILINNMISGKILRDSRRHCRHSARIQVVGTSQRMLRCLKEIYDSGIASTFSLKQPRDAKLINTNGKFEYKND